MTKSSINPQSAIRPSTGSGRPEALEGRNPQSQRLWRVRRQGAWIDARLRDAAAPGDVELQYFYDGQLLVATQWRTRDEAVAEADVRLRDLQRVGWTLHW